MTEICIEPTEEGFAAVRALEHDGPIVMLNLLRFDHENDGAARYGTYVQAVMPLLDGCGAEIVYAGAGGPTVIGGERWDAVILVRYPTKQAFLDMIQSEAYAAVSHHRTAALADSRLVLTVEQSVI